MPGLNTGGFQLQLPNTPVIPPDIGKVDVKSIYDRVTQALEASRALANSQAATDSQAAQLGAVRSNALAQQAIAPTAAAAEIAKNNRSTALASPAIVNQEVEKASTGLDADLVAEQNRRNQLKFVGALTQPQQIVLASNGPSKTSDSSTTLSADGKTFQGKQTVTANVGGEAVPISTATESSPAVPVLTPITGANGQPLGTAVTSPGANGVGTTHVAAAPLAALNGIVTGSERHFIGAGQDAQGNPTEKIQVYTTSAAGGQPKPVGSPYEIPAGSDPTVIRPSGVATPVAQPIISQSAAKAIEDTQGELSTLQTRKLELQNISNAATKFIDEGVGSGKFVGPLRSSFGDTRAQEFTGSVQNALQTALQPLRGTGRVSNTEFQQALQALPTINDSAPTIKAKLGYLQFVTDWAQARQQTYLENLGKGLNPYRAFQAAQQATPVPDLPDFYNGQAAPGYVQPAPSGVAAPATATATPAKTLSPQDQAALDFARKNPTDPRSAAILQHLGVQ